MSTGNHANVYAPTFNDLSDLACSLWRRHQFYMARKIALCAAAIAGDDIGEDWMLWVAWCADERLAGRISELEELIG